MARAPMRKFLLPFTILPVLAALVAGCGGSGGGVPANSVAVVGETTITKGEFDALLHRAEVSYKSRKQAFPKAGTVEYQQLKQQALQILTQRAEFEQQAKKLGVVVSDKQVDDRLAQLKKQYFGGDEKKYREQLKQSGLTEADLREDIRSQLISEGIYSKVTASVKVMDKDVERYYRSHIQQYRQAETRVIRHILIEKKPLADKLYTQLKDGADFAKLAKKYSKDPGSASQGGKLTITRGQTVAPFDQTAFLMHTGQISHPVKTQYGYHIILALGDIKPAKTTPLKDVKDSIRQQLLQQKKNDAMTKWVDETKKDYSNKIRYQVGFAPASTSSTTSTQ
jgi:parvulin-like peptidyl-prolyl isomerase